MRLRFDSVLLFAATLAPVRCHEGGKDHEIHHQHHHSTKNHETELSNLPHTHVMFHHVEKACASDVKTLCDATPAPVVPAQTTGDPFLDWLFIPMSPPPPEFRDLNRMMDRIFDPLFMEPSRDYVTLYWVEEPQHAPQFLIDSVAAKAAEQRQPEEIPQLAHDLKLYGNEVLLKHDQNSFQYKMARRLTEIDSVTIQHNLHLPFGCAKNRCLREALADSKVSLECQESIQDMESTFAMESAFEQQEDIFLGMMWLYVAALCILLLQWARKLRAQRSKRELRMRIIQSVYSNPEIKRQVEHDLGQSVGFIPPLSLHAFSLIGRGGRDLKDTLRCMRRVHIIFFVLLLTLIVFAPVWVLPIYCLPICIVLSIFRVAKLCVLQNNAVDNECECCCCGARTSDATNGTLTQDQECCSCCKGTGVCAPACADCCGPKSLNSNACGTMTEDCCCIEDMKVNECTCCCCGATPSQSRDGTLSVDQACCNCCRGTGTCSAGCASCCDNGCSCGGDEKQQESVVKGRGQKHVVSARNEIYCGVPLQVV